MVFSVKETEEVDAGYIVKIEQQELMEMDKCMEHNRNIGNVLLSFI